MTSSVPVIDSTTVYSLLTVCFLLLAAHILSRKLLPSHSPRKVPTSTRSHILFIWHAFDALIHFLFEGSFLYHCFFSSSPYSSPDQLFTPAGVYFRGPSYSLRVYGAAHGQSATARLWQEYAKADRRWAGADLTIISIELLTVGLCGPIAVYVCYLLSCGHGDGQEAEWEVTTTSATSTASRAKLLTTKFTKKTLVDGKLAFWMIGLATAELYGGFMTFAPEWMSGNTNLDGSNWMYMWLYLFFFNMLWVVMPLYSLFVAYTSISEPPPPLIRFVKKAQ